ncbi:hypothetical protein AB0H83_37385 [Dactylosporangium sp. NPDC050688]|uniref:hypothetical protein n=1 Tax=Dactylosporangium sp. NPDC050688 TaxID=3157217 RepID=UPI0033F411A8
MAIRTNERTSGVAGSARQANSSRLGGRSFTETVTRSAGSAWSSAATATVPLHSTGCRH